MNASKLGSKDWWEVVLTMPALEALDHIKGFKESVIEKHAGESNFNSISVHISRANREIKRLNILRNNASWQQAARNVLPPELYEQVCVERHRLELLKPQ